MKKETTKKKGLSKGKMLAVGAGVAAVGAGAYYFLGPKGNEHKKKAKVLMAKMEKEAKNKIKAAKDMSGPIYHQAVDMLAEKYSKQYKIHEGEIKALAQKLKSKYRGAAKKATKPGGKTSSQKGKKRS